MDCSLPGFSVHGIFQARVPRVGCHFLLQGIFPTQGSNPGLLHCRHSLPSEPWRKPHMCVYISHTYMCVHAKSLQLCLTLCDPTDCGLPISSVHGILQTRILGKAAMPSSRGSSWPRNRTCISCIAGGFFYCWATGEAHTHTTYTLIILNYFHYEKINDFYITIC